MTPEKEVQRPSFNSRLFYLLSAIQISPLLCLPFYPEDLKYTSNFIFPALLTALLGLFFGERSKNRKPSLSIPRQREVVVVVSIWLYAFLVGSLPFILASQLPPLEAVFESTSGWTTTGFTVMDVDRTPAIFLLYRSIMQYTGGIGFVLLMLLFSSGKEAMKLFSAEGHPDILEPNLVSTARLMMVIYGVFTAIGILCYTGFGMPLFDAVNHSMTAMGTGGFSTRADSIGYYQSPAIEAVTIVLMLAGATNFAILALPFKGRWREIFHIGELKFAALIIASTTLVISLLGAPGIYSSLEESTRIALFQVVSALTSTGFSTTTLTNWYPSMHMALIIVMLVGGGAGSTAGGIKYSRIYILYKSFTATLTAKFQPELAVNEPYIYKPGGKVYLSPGMLLNVHHFTLVYLTVFFLGVFILTLTGAALDDAMFEFASSLGTIGLSLNLTSASSGSAFLIVQLLGMVLARLEVYIVFIFLAAGVNKVKNIKTM